MGRPASCGCDKCAKCKQRIYMRAYYHRNAEKQRAQARKTRLRHLADARARDRARGFRPGDKTKERARRRVAQAIKSGRLVRLPCQICGVTPAQAHHEDYALPLNVEWLCTRHHGERHQMVA